MAPAPTLTTISDDFGRAVDVVLRYEGGYVHDPVDPGGETKYGISKRAYPDLDIRALTREQARTIYRRDYWVRFGCDRLAWPLSLVHFDACVNHGGGRARKLLGLSQGDWVVYLREREAFYDRLVTARPPLRRFRRGWQNRLDDLRRVVAT